MRKATTTLFITGALAACGDDGGSGPSKVTVELDTQGPPQLVAVRQGDGDWQAIAVAGNRYAIEVTQPYIVAVACNDAAGLIDSYQFARTLDDPPRLEAPCIGDDAALDGRAVGTLASAGEITVGFAIAFVGGAGQGYDIPAASGPREIVASDQSRIAVRRITVAGVTQVPPIDLAVDGGAFVPANLSIANQGGDTPFVSVRLFTEHATFAAISSTSVPQEAKLVPDGVLGAADRQIVSVSVGGNGGSRTVVRADVRAATDATYALPEALAGAAMSEVEGHVAATWGALPEHDALGLTIEQTSDDGETFLFHDLDISQAYAELGTATLDLAIPGFQPAWKVDLTKRYDRSIVARRERSPGEVALSTVFERINAAAADGDAGVTPRGKRHPRRRG